MIFQILFLLSLVATQDSVRDTSFPDLTSIAIEEEYSVSIEKLEIKNGSLNDTVDIILDAKNKTIAGFQFKIGFDSKYINVDKIFPGKLVDSCKWEMFRAQRLYKGDEVESPGQFWQVLGLAKTTPNEKKLVCESFEEKISVCKLVLSGKEGELIPDHTAEIFFYWEDCRDNVISSAEGARLFMSSASYDFNNSLIEKTEDDFPSKSGTISKCINPELKNAPKQMIKFYSGGVEFKFSAVKSKAKDSATQK